MKFNPSDLTPVASYRIQFSKTFTFSHLKEILPYLHQLGISTLYASPVFSAVPGSTHGYDVTDPHTVNPEIGTLEEWRALSTELKKYGIWWLQDIVPNHMAFHENNYRLWNVLEWGEKSPYSNYFDINWHHPHPELNGKLMVPFLGEEADEAIEKGNLTIQFNTKGWQFRYNDSFFPLSPDSLELLAGFASAVPGMETVENSIRNLLTGMKEITTYEALQEMKTAWIQILSTNESFNAALENFLTQVNNSILLRKKVLEAQHYRLTYWNATSGLINYRRFFTVNNLICLNMQEESVFREYHQLLEQLYKEGLVQGFRIDHIDGLADPENYLHLFRKTFGEACYVVAEKILAHEEQVPATWPLQGTSGYDFLHFANQLYLNNEGFNELKTFYRKHISKDDPTAIIQHSKELILEMYMRGEWDNLVHTAETNALLNNNTSREQARTALKHFLTRMPVYRLYPPHHHHKEEKKILENVLKAIREKTNDISWLENVWQREEDGMLSPGSTFFLQRTCQLAAPLMAKGVEDTTFYRYTPLIALNEVGDDPDCEKISQEKFHQLMLQRMESSAFTMNASSTHDTKRGEDARIRILTLSHFPEKWMQTFEQWQRLNDADIQANNITPEEAWYIYHSLIGGFTEEKDFADRAVQAHLKWVREAKVKTCWNDPDTDYEQRIEKFTRTLCDATNLFYQSLSAFVEEMDVYAQTCSLAQLTVKCMTPGMPDIYHGNESTNFSFVDPDNRRPVDFKALHKIEPGNRNWEAAKMGLTKALLRIRRQYTDCFTKGNYLPLDKSAKEEILCFARVYDRTWVMVIASGKKGIVNPASAKLSSFIQLPQDAPEVWRDELNGNDGLGFEDIQLHLKETPVVILSGQAK